MESLSLRAANIRASQSKVAEPRLYIKQHLGTQTLAGCELRRDQGNEYGLVCTCLDGSEACSDIGSVSVLRSCPDICSVHKCLRSTPLRADMGRQSAAQKVYSTCAAAHLHCLSCTVCDRRLQANCRDRYACTKSPCQELVWKIELKGARYTDAPVLDCSTQLKGTASLSNSRALCPTGTVDRVMQVDVSSTVLPVGYFLKLTT